MNDDAQPIIEIQILGHTARVCAIDPLTGAEAVVSAPASASRADLERLAVRKLQYVLKRQAKV